MAQNGGGVAQNGGGVAQNGGGVGSEPESRASPRSPTESLASLRGTSHETTGSRRKIFEIKACSPHAEGKSKQDPQMRAVI